MDLELNRRSFLIVLGVATVAAGARARSRGHELRSAPLLPRCFFAPVCAEPAGRPRSSAIIYVPSPVE